MNILIHAPRTHAHISLRHIFSSRILGLHSMCTLLLGAAIFFSKVEILEKCFFIDTSMANVRDFLHSGSWPKFDISKLLDFWPNWF